MPEDHEQSQREFNEKVHITRMNRQMRIEDYLEFKVTESLIKCQCELELLEMYKLGLLPYGSEYHKELQLQFSEIKKQMEEVGEI